jgi:catechol 2,3-dioxygenase-like lactoylglutathione lyase family enzyme
MGFHHVAVATRDMAATHAFYTGPMGFTLAKVVAGKTEAGWAKHLFYETHGSGLIAFWDLHDESIPKDFDPAIATGLGLPIWSNHIAFDAQDLSDIEAKKKRLLDHGVDVMEIDHGWCTSIYARDPNGILVEFCTTTEEFTQADREDAMRLFHDPNPPLESAKQPVLHRALMQARSARSEP